MRSRALGEVRLYGCGPARDLNTECHGSTARRIAAEIFRTRIPELAFAKPEIVYLATCRNCRGNDSFAPLIAEAPNARHRGLVAYPGPESPQYVWHVLL